MKRKAIALTALLSAILLLLPACAMRSYRTDAEPKKVLDLALAELNDGIRYSTADEKHFSSYFQLPDSVTDVEVRYSSDANKINEIGILRVKDNTANEAAELLEGYLSRAYSENQTFYDSYIPQETAKLRDAEVKIFGNYVVYTILDAPARKAVFRSIKEQLTEK